MEDLPNDGFFKSFFKNEKAIYIAVICILILACIYLFLRGKDGRFENIVDKQKAEIERLESDLDSAKQNLEQAIEKLKDIKNGINGAIKTVEQSDSIVGELKIAMVDAGNTIAEIKNRNALITKLVKELLEEYNRVKEELRTITSQAEAGRKEE
jgi:septal ring factor EnvC (AmiA/AmiB activator)